MARNDGPDAAALFEAANKLRGSVESAEYKHLVLWPIFLKNISDSFDFRREQLRTWRRKRESAAAPAQTSVRFRTQVAPMRRRPS